MLYTEVDSLNQFGGSSTKRLFHAHTDLSLLSYDVLAHFDISILCSTRNKEAQTKAFNNGYSNATFGKSPHNYEKSLAIDVGLWKDGGVDYMDEVSFQKIMDCFKLHAEARGIEIVCGLDFKSFKDMPHIQLKHWREMSVDSSLVD